MKITKFDNIVDMEDWIDTFFSVNVDDQHILIVVRSVLLDNGKWETGLFIVGSFIPIAWATRMSSQRVEAEDDHKVFIEAVLERLTYKDGVFIGKKKKKERSK